MRKIIVLFAFVALTGASAFAAQSTASHGVTTSVPEVVLLGLNSTSSITLNVVAPSNAGDQPTGQSNASKYLYYTTVNASGTHRNISVAWGASDATSAGTSLHVAAAVSSSPAFGNAGSAVSISNAGQNIVTGIPSCATGQGVNGVNLNYTLQVDTPASLVQGDTKSVTITYTLTDAS